MLFVSTTMEGSEVCLRDSQAELEIFPLENSQAPSQSCLKLRRQEVEPFQ